MDLTFKTDEGRFNLRVCAVFLREGRVLAMKDGRSPYYYLPGGRVKLHERAEEAILREVREELMIHARILRPLWLCQSFFTEDVTGEHFHELCLYFLADAPQLPFQETPFTQWEAEDKPNVFTWLPVEKLPNEYIYPVFLRTALARPLPDQLTLITENQ